jgi:hypothetical protein
MTESEYSEANASEAPSSGEDKKPETKTPPLRKESKVEFRDLVSLLIAYALLLFGSYGFLSFFSPALLSELNSNLSGTAGILTFGFMMFAVIVKAAENLTVTSFVEIDRKARGESSMAGRQFGRSALTKLSSSLVDIVSSSLGVDFRISERENASRTHGSREGELDVDVSVGRNLETAFELHTYHVVDGLNKHISLTEEKGSNLLDRGLLFLFGGIFFYVSAIIGWQAWAKYGEPNERIMYIGMFASSVVFLVCEFLAAWFLKQYRHYVDASLACLRVKSVYDRYLLSYYAVKEIGNESDEVPAKLSRMLEVLKEDVMWPAHRENVNNDFNYMLQSVSAAHASLDKLKGLLDTNSKSPPPEGK